VNVERRREGEFRAGLPGLNKEQERAAALCKSDSWAVDWREKGRWREGEQAALFVKRLEGRKEVAQGSQ
jgi:hypothetical protein